MASDRLILPSVDRPPDAPGPTVSDLLEALRAVMHRLADHADTAEYIANRLGGSKPENKTDAGIKPRSVPNGLVDDLVDLVEAANVYADRIMVANERSRAALG